ncbi:MAG: hypothetical protein ACPGO3_12450 [Magnetospiraceae bacterium]
MARMIPISTAARAVGLKRAELTRRIRAADIEMFEGQVDYERLKCILPSLDLDDAGAAAERVRFIRENPIKSREKQALSHPSRNLEAEVKRLMTEVLVQTRRAEEYRAVLADMVDHLSALTATEEGAREDLAFELCAWLRRRIDSRGD